MNKPITARKKPHKHSHNKALTKSKPTASGSVRIIGGQFKRRGIDFIDADGLRPTPDRLRETLFNWLLADIHGARVLDSCAGSGVLGFEALSRGAAHCTFIEVNPAQSQMLQKSAEQLRLDSTHYRIMSNSAEKALTQLQKPQNLQDLQASQNERENDIGLDKTGLHKNYFDLVFIDPPYAEELWQPILTALITQSLINTETLIYLEADKDLAKPLQQLADTLKDNASFEAFSGFECLKQTKVGQVVAGLYQLSAS